MTKTEDWIAAQNMEATPELIETLRAYGQKTFLDGMASALLWWAKYPKNKILSILDYTKEKLCAQ